MIAWLGIWPRVPRSLIVLLWVLLAGATPILLIRPLIPHSLAPHAAAIWITSLTISTVLLISVTHALSAKAGSSLPALTTALSVGATGICLAMSGYATMLPAALGLAVAMGACAVVGTLPRLASLGGPGAGAICLSMVVLIGLWTLGYFYADLPGSEAILLVVSVPTLWVIDRLPVGRRSVFRLTSGRLIVACIPIAAAMVLAAIRFSHGADSLR